MATDFNVWVIVFLLKTKSPFINKFSHQKTCEDSRPAIEATYIRDNKLVLNKPLKITECRFYPKYPA